MDWELWGTFSVGDHLRRRAFVADVLLYDRLVIPTPPESDTTEEQRWCDMGWRPERQQRILKLIGQDRVIRVPWTQGHRNGWEALYLKARGKERFNTSGGETRSRMAEAVAADVSRTVTARESFDWQGFKNRGGLPEEVDKLAHLTSREYLVDWSNLKSDTKLFTGLPKVEVDAVAAYGSYSAFSRDHRVELSATQQTPQERLLQLFGWEFLVPSDSRLSDENLLKQALELADLDETKEHRKQFHLWRREVLLTGKPANQAIREMSEAIDDYRAAVRKSKVKHGTEYAFAIASATLGVAAVALPPLGIPAAFAGLGAFVVSKSAQNVMPQKLKIAAMFHDARKRFGWYA